MKRERLLIKCFFIALFVALGLGSFSYSSAQGTEFYNCNFDAVRASRFFQAPPNGLGWTKFTNTGQTTPYWECITTNAPRSARNQVKSAISAGVTVENWLVTSEIATITANAKLSIFCKSVHSASNLRIAVSKTGKEIADFSEIVFDGTVEVTEAHEKKEANIPAGTKYIAFIHHTTSAAANAWLFMDDLVVREDTGGSTVAQYAVTLEPVENGTLSIQGKTNDELQAIDEGTELTVVPTPATDYEVTEVRINGRVTQAPYTFTVTGPTTVGATFSRIINEFPVTIEKMGMGEVAIEGYTPEMLQAVPRGTTLTLQITPAEDWILAGVAVNDVVLSNDNLTFTVNGPTSIVVRFQQLIINYPVELQAVENGRISIEGKTTEELREVRKGTELTVVAEPNEGYDLTEVRINDVALASPYTFRVTAPTRVSATFTKRIIYHAVELMPTENGTLRIDGKTADELQFIPEGTELTIIPTANEGYELTEVRVNDVVIEAPYKFTVSAASRVSATFTKKIVYYAVEVQEAVNGTVLIKDKTPDDLEAVAEGTELTILPTPNEGYHVKEVRVNGEVVASPYTFTVTGETVISVIFERTAIDAYPVTIEKVGEGTITIQETMGDGTIKVYTEEMLQVVPKGSFLQLIATPAEGYSLRSVLVNGAQITDQEIMFLVNEPTTVTVNFRRKVVTYAVELLPTENGKIEIAGKTPQELRAIPTGTELRVFATPNSGYELKEIRINNEVLPKPYRFVVTAATQVSAKFVKKQEEPVVTSDFSENFDASAALPGGWTTRTNDDNNWVYTNQGAYSPEGCVHSTVAAYQGRISHWLVSPALNLEKRSTLAFQCAPEGFEGILLVYASSKENPTQDEDFTQVFEEMVHVVVQGTYVKREVTIPAGTKHIAFVHRSINNVSSSGYKLDDITIKPKTLVSYAVTLENVEHGTLSIAGKTAEELNAVVEGTELTVVATPAEGYELEEVRVNDQPLAAPYKFTVEGATKVSAIFRAAAVTTVAVKVEKIGEGTVTIRENENKVYTDEMLKAVPVGSFLELIATPAEGYVLKSVLVNGAAPADDPIFFSVTEETNIVVKFEKKAVYYAVTLAPTENGTISIKDKTAEQLKSIKEGTELTVEVTPNQGYVLHSLTANGADIKGTRTFKVAANTEVKAVFAKENAIDGVNGQVARIYPNPAQEFVVVEGVEANTIVRIAMMDGRFVAEANADETGAARFNVAAWARGNYLVVINGKAQVVVLR